METISKNTYGEYLNYLIFGSSEYPIAIVIPFDTEHSVLVAMTGQDKQYELQESLF